jgi:hypothetical protein
MKRSHRDSSSSERSTPFSRDTSVDIKIVHLDADSALADEPAVMKCSLPPHEPLTFASIEEHDVHYQKTHVNRCSECQKNFPDEHFLHLHIAEYHDPINAAKRDKGERTVGHVSLHSSPGASFPKRVAPSFHTIFSRYGYVGKLPYESFS